MKICIHLYSQKISFHNHFGLLEISDYKYRIYECIGGEFADRLVIKELAKRLKDVLREKLFVGRVSWE